MGAIVAVLAAVSPATAQARTRPVNTTRPTITGRAIQGSILTAWHGRWTHRPTSFTYRWQRCPRAGRCRTIRHRTARRYRLRRADVGHRIRAVVTASNGLMSKPARSRLTALVKPPPPATAYQLNAQHTGYSPDAFSTTASERWWDDLGASVSYPLIVNGRMFVIVADDSHGTPPCTR